MKKILFSMFAFSGVLASAQMTDLPLSASQTTIVSGQNVQITTTGSQIGYQYALRDDSNNSFVDGPIAGTGGDLVFNTGAISSSTSYNVYGTNGFAASLSFSNDRINFGDNNRGIDKEITIAAWIKTGSSSGLRNIMIDYGSDDAGFILRVDANGRVTIDGRDGTNTYKSSGASSTVVTDNQWHYIVGAIDLNAGLWGISVDGNPENFQNYGPSGVSLANTDDLNIGSSFSTSNAYVGEIRDVTIWNKVLTGPEMIANMGACLTGSENDVVAHFLLNEGFGTNVIDYSATAIDGTILFGGAPFAGNTSTCKFELEMSQIIDITVGAGTGVFVDSIDVQGQAGVSEIVVSGATLQIEATVLPANADDGTYTWSVSNGTGSGTVDVNGVLTAVSDGTVDVIATANDGSGIIGFTTITLSNQNVGVNEIDFKNISIYPNPVQNELFIESIEGQITEMAILDYAGRVVKSITKLNTNSIDVSDLNQGIYILKVSTENGVSTKRFVKQD
ncbi:MAG: hypothetical protein ACJA0U_000093 [Salibacteraceae bacterium]|jgi:hypothetical protein